MKQTRAARRPQRRVTWNQHGILPPNIMGKTLHTYNILMLLRKVMKLLASDQQLYFDHLVIHF